MNVQRLRCQEVKRFMEEMFQVGVITTTHGIRGEVKVFPTTDDPKRFKSLKQVLLDTGEETLTLDVEHVKFFKQFVILKFKGWERIEDAQPYLKKPLLVTREHAVKLKKNEYFIADLVGMEVFDEDEQRLGELINVIQTGANDVYEVSREGEKSLLIPAIRQCILSVDVEGRRMSVHLLEGLVDL